MFDFLFATKPKELIVPAFVTSNRQSYDFSYTLKQWIAGYQIELAIKGTIGLSSSMYAGDVERWGIRLSGLEMDWSKPYVPEQYLFFYAFQAIECYWDNTGKLVGNFDVLGQRDLLYYIQHELKNNIDDPQRLKSLNILLKELFAKPQFIEQVFLNHPLIKLFVQLKGALDLRRKETLQYGSALMSEYKDYFSKDIPLLLKSCWLAQEDSHAPLVLTKIGGLAQEYETKDEFRKLMVNLQGHVLADSTLHVDYCDNYVLDSKDKPDILQLYYAESLLETIVSETWYKREAIQLYRKEVDNGRK